MLVAIERKSRSGWPAVSHSPQKRQAAQIIEAIAGINKRPATWLRILTQDAEPSGKTLVDAHNGFNELSRLAMLWTVRHRWPAGARFAFN